MNVQSIELEVDNPEQTFLFPDLRGIKRWQRRAGVSELEARLEFLPGVYLLSELLFDDHDLGVFTLEYVDRLIEFDRSQRQIDWSAPVAIINRNLLRPVPDHFLDYLQHYSGDRERDFRALSESFLAFLGEQSSLTIRSNEEYRLLSTSGQSESDFKLVCLERALADRSDRAMELGTVLERKLDQLAGRLEPPLVRPGTKKDEITYAYVEAFQLACKSLITFAVNWRTREQADLPLEPRALTQAFEAALRLESERLAQGLDHYREDFSQFAEWCLRDFTELEDDINRKALTINTVDVPLTRCTISLLRVSKVWLPYWNTDMRENGESKSRMLRAF